MLLGRMCKFKCNRPDGDGGIERCFASRNSWILGAQSVIRISLIERMVIRQGRVA